MSGLFASKVLLLVLVLALALADDQDDDSLCESANVLCCSNMKFYSGNPCKLRELCPVPPFLQI